MNFHRLLFGLLCTTLSLGLGAQIQMPSDFLPHKLGETFTPHHLLVDYFEHVAANSAMVELMEYGRTNEDRPLMLAVVSSEENMAQIEAIRENQLKRAGLLPGT
ncbi:MAG: zinc carboxypeptidase, partial [Bacteroidota bacterium]